ncbi:MAG: hypothetical protein K5639_08095 [Eubacterium sp.]|nr:hypothetical protein [Eubacterium sp.]
MKARKILAIVAICCLGILATENASNAKTSSPDNEIFGFLDSVNVASYSVELNIKSGVAQISSGVTGRPGTSKIALTVYLQKYDSNRNIWSDVRSWKADSNNSIVRFSKSYDLISKGKYRCKMNASVTRDGKSESVSKISSSKTY